MTKSKYTEYQRTVNKQLRESAKILKKQGLIDSNYNIRNIDFTDKKIKRLINKYPDIISGAIKTIKLSAKKTKYYKEQGYNVIKGRVAVAVSAGDKVYKTGDEFRIKTTGEGGSIIRYDAGFDSKNLNKWETQIRQKFKKLKKNEVLSFQYFGTNSYASFANADLMISYLNRYPLYDITDKNIDKISEIISNVTIFKLDRDVSQRNVPFISKAKKYTKKEYYEIKKAEKAEERKKNPPKKKEYDPRVIDYQNKLRREKRKNNPETDPVKIEATRIKNKLAAKKYRLKIKGK